MQVAEPRSYAWTGKAIIRIFSLYNGREVSSQSDL